MLAVKTYDEFESFEEVFEDSDWPDVRFYNIDKVICVIYSINYVVERSKDVWCSS